MEVLQDPAYLYWVWITLIKLPYAPLRGVHRMMIQKVVYGFPRMSALGSSVNRNASRVAEGPSYLRS